MKKKLFTVLVAIVLFASVLGVFAACDPDATGTFTLPIDGIDGVTDANVDMDTKTVTFRVQSSYSSFPLSSIKFKDGAKLELRAFADKDLNEEIEGDSVPLAEGENVFYIMGWFAAAPAEYDVFAFRVTRTEAAAEVTGITLDLETWNEFYLLNEQFKGGKLIATMKDGSTQLVDITADMVTGFDTSEYGKFDLTITYGNFSLTASIQVSAPESTEDLSLGAWQTSYLIGEEIYLDGAYLLYEGSTKISITTDMVTGFDSSEEGENMVFITYAGNTISAPIRVYSDSLGEFEEVTPNENLDKALLKADLERIAAVFPYLPADDDEVVDTIFTIVKAGGITNEQFSGAVDIAVGGDAAFLSGLYTAIDEGDDFEEVWDMIVSRESIVELQNFAGYLSENLTPRGTASMISSFLALIFYSDPNAAADYYEIYVSFNDVSLGIESSYNNSAYFNDLSSFYDYNDELKAFWEEFISQEDITKSIYSSVMEMLTRDEVAYSLNNLLNTLSILKDYDTDRLLDLLSTVKEAIVVLLDGSLSDILSGDALSYKEMIDALNTVGDLIQKELGDILDDPLLIKLSSSLSSYVLDVLDINADLGMDLDAENMAYISTAMYKVLTYTLTEITPELASNLYMDFDDYNKEEVEPDKTEKLGLFAVRVGNFLSPVVKELQLKEINAIYDMASMLAPLFELNPEPMLDLIFNWQNKPIDEYTDEERRQIGAQVQDALDALFVDQSATGNSLYSYQSAPAFVPVNFTREQLCTAILQVANIYFYDASLDSKMEITDLTNYQLNYTSEGEGYFVLTLTVEGMSTNITCYAYDSSTPGNFTLFGSLERGMGFVLLKDTEVPDLADFMDAYYLPTTFLHNATGTLVDAEDVVDLSTFYVEGIDTSLPAGVYGAIGHYNSEIFGDVTFPVLYNIYDAQDEVANIRDVHYYNLPKVLPVGEEITGSATVYFGYAYSTRISFDSSNVTGLDNTQVGEQIITITIPGLEEFAYTTTLRVVTEAEARTITYAYVSANSPKLTLSEDFLYSEAINISVQVDMLYSPYSFSCSGTPDEVSKELQEYGLRLQVDVDTSAIVDDAKGGVSLLLEDGTLLDSTTFTYDVFDPDVQPPQILHIDTSVWQGFSSVVYTENEIKSVTSFLNRADQCDVIMSFTLTDGRTVNYETLLSEYGSLLSSATITYEYQYGNEGYNTYSITLTADFFRTSYNGVNVIPDAMKNVPTRINVYSQSTYLQFEQAELSDFYVTATLGYGYDSLTIDTSDPDCGLDFTLDTSVAGETEAVLTYGIISTRVPVDVISLDEATEFSLRNSWNISNISLPSGASVSDLMDNTAFDYYDLFFRYSPFDYSGTLTEHNDYFANNFPDLDLEFSIEDFNSDAGLHTARIMLYADNGTSPIQKFISDVIYSIAPASASNDTITEITYVYSSRDVFSQSEVADGAYQELLTFSVMTLGGSHTNYGATEMRAQGTRYEFVQKEGVYDLEISTDYAYYRMSGIEIIPDMLTTKVTDWRFSSDDTLLLDLSNYTLNAGVDFEIIAEYGNGYDEQTITDYSQVRIVRTSPLFPLTDIGYRYAVTYMGITRNITVINTSSASLYTSPLIDIYLSNASGNGNVGDNVEDIEVSFSINLHMSTVYLNVSVDFPTATIAQHNEALSRMGFELTLTEVDTSVSGGSYGTLTLTRNNSSPVDDTSIYVYISQ